MPDTTTTPQAETNPLGPRAAAGSAARARTFRDDDYFEWGDEDEYMIHWQGATDEDYSMRTVYYAEVTGVVDTRTDTEVDLGTRDEPSDWWRQHGEAVEAAANERAGDYYDNW